MPTLLSTQGVPEERIRVLRSEPPRKDATLVLYWMTAFRRLRCNFALQRAAAWARDLKLPLLILEPLRLGYRWASARLHQFVIDGMADHAVAARRYSRGVRYYPYVEPSPGAGGGMLEAIAQRAAVVVTDDFPCFFLPGLLEWARRKLPLRLEAVDSNGLLPLRAPGERVFTMAYHFRRWLQKNLRPYLEPPAFPQAEPLAGVTLPPCPERLPWLEDRWPAADLAALNRPGGLAQLALENSVPPAPLTGGPVAAERTLTQFLEAKLARYADERSDPEEQVASGLSPYLHFGHTSAHEVVRAATEREGWSPERISSRVDGKAQGWWGASPALEAFLDELITWRELGFNLCARRSDYDRYESLPDWAQRTLDRHARDPRPHGYTREQFEQAATHDPLWNAAQRQLLREGRIHNYLRMLWGKKVLEWSATPQEALETLVELNNKYALDGRDPNSYSGIFWCFGRYDRPWAPERAIFGQVRYMSSDNTARKFRVKGYLQQYAAAGQGTLFE